MRLSVYLGAAAASAALLLGYTARRAAVSAPTATIDAKGILLARGTSVTLNGQMQGPPGERFEISVLMEQAQAGRQVDAVAVAAGTFTGALQPWTLTMSAPPGNSFAPGPALVWGIGRGTGFVARVTLHK